MTGAAHVGIVGASLGGLRAAEQLRAAGHRGPITVFGAEPYLPYNRPPLSKEILRSAVVPEAAEWAQQLAFHRRSSITDVQFRLGQPVAAADLAALTLTTEDGCVASFDGLVIATGLRPRRLELPGPRAGRHWLRSIDDGHRLARQLATLRRARVVVLGAGFIGMEVAASLSQLGHAVTVLEPAAAPLERVLGAEVGRAIERHLTAAGVEFRLGTGASAYTGSATITGVQLTDGTRLAADVVIEAVGSVPNVEWLAGNGLDLADGVLVNAHLQLPAYPAVVAVGDVARFPNPRFDDVPRRVEHWSMPSDTARRAARTLTGVLAGTVLDASPFTPLPTFWSDQQDLRLQSVGSPSLADAHAVIGGDLRALADGVIVEYTRCGRPIGAVAINVPPVRMAELRTTFSELQLAA